MLLGSLWESVTALCLNYISKGYPRETRRIFYGEQGRRRTWDGHGGGVKIPRSSTIKQIVQEFQWNTPSVSTDQ